MCVDSDDVVVAKRFSQEANKNISKRNNEKNISVNKMMLLLKITHRKIIKFIHLVIIITTANYIREV